MPQTLVERMATAHIVPAGSVARSGDIVTIRPRHIMTHDNTSAVMAKFKAIGAERVVDPRQPVFAIDHDIQNLSSENLGKYARIEAFAREQGVDFYPAGTGISHQVMMEEGYVVPGSVVMGSDSHSNLYGAGAALGTPVVRTDAASIWATGVTWWRVPDVARVELRGELRQGVVGKDVIIALCGLFNHDEVLNMAVEFTGDGIAGLSVDQRMSIANMTTEWGALAGVFPFDDVLRDFLYERAAYLDARGIDRFTRSDVDAWQTGWQPADADAAYAVELTLDLSTVIPHVSGPDHVKVMRALPDIERERVSIDKAYLLSCVNGRLEDLDTAARVLDNRRVADGVAFYVAAASANVQRAAEANGSWQKLVDAGAVPLPPGCGTCIGLGQGTLEPGEVAISATNRNFKGRMGSRDARAYLASPAVVAASAVGGYVCGPEVYESVEPRIDLCVHTRAVSSGAVDIVDGFPARIEGRSLWLPVDNLNTDGIYAGGLTYRDDVTPAAMAEAAMANYDPAFADIARDGDIVVSGRNFGTGSSREQAATCLELRGIACVIAASFSETYRRNALNNGFIVVECPELVDHMRGCFARETAATIPGPMLAVDFAGSTIEVDGARFAFTALTPVAQELIVAGGAEAVLKRRLANE